MSRRSSRLVNSGYYQVDDDAASNSSRESVGKISYRESPVRIFKKRRRTHSSRGSSRSSSICDTQTTHSRDQAVGTDDFRVPSPPAGRSRSKGSHLKDSGHRSSSKHSKNTNMLHSSGYSSTEEAHIRPRHSSAQSPGEPDFGLVDVICSPGRALAILYWKLGSALYSLISCISLLNVFLLSRRTPGVRKALVLLLLLGLLAFGVWHTCPSFSLFLNRAYLRWTRPNAPAFLSHTTESLSLITACSLKDDVSSTLRGRDYDRGEREERGERGEREECNQLLSQELRNIQKEIFILKQDGNKLKEVFEEVRTELSDLSVRVQSVSDEERLLLGQEVGLINEQIAEMRTQLSNIVATGDLLNNRVDAQDTQIFKLKEELISWLVQYLSFGPDGTGGVVLQPSLQVALEELEQKLVARLSEQKRKTHEKDRLATWRAVEETLTQEGIATIRDVEQIVNRAMSLFQADKIGMADYALESSGASVVNTRCSETYRTRSACVSVFGIPLWYHTESPRSVLQPDLYPGKCWAFRGSEGFLVISLSYAVRITHVSLEHLPRILSPTGRIDSAPRDFTVYGLSHEHDEGTLLGTYSYDQDGDPVQTFKLRDSEVGVYQMVELRILSNWGHPEYTCVYRFRVHGQVE